MIRLLSDYYKQKNSGKPICLGMSIMVRDEEDIIEKNIRFHHKMGVSKFFIVNNASIDKTPDIIESLKKDFNIHLVSNEDKTGHLHERTMTMLMRIAKQAGCDWLINNDADEFWMPDNQTSLLSYLNRQDAVLQINRFNMQNYQGLPSIFESELLCYRPVEYDFSHTDFNTEYINVNLASCLYKVMTNIHGLVKIRGGNHAAKHAADWRKRRRFTKKCDEITIYHYPIRSFEQFEKRVNIIKQIGDAGRISQMGGSARYWYSASCQNKIEEAYEEVILKSQDITPLINQDVLRKESTPKEVFRKLDLI